MNFNEEQIALYTIYSNIDLEIAMPYTNIFKEYHTPISFPTKEIKLDHALFKSIKAKFMQRGTAVPVGNITGHASLSITPPTIGLGFPLTANDSAKTNVGVSKVFANGQFQENTLYTEANFLKLIKRSIMETTETMCAEVFLTSEIKELGLNYDDNGDSNKGDFAFDSASGEKLSLKIVELWKEYMRTKKYFPAITVGDSVLTELIKEVETSGTKNTRGDYSISVVGEGMNRTIELKVDLMDIPFRVLRYATDYSGNMIETKNLIQLHAPETLVLTYAVNHIVDGSGNPTTLVGEYAVGKVSANEETAQGKIFGRSHPLPIIVENSLVERRQLVVS